MCIGMLIKNAAGKSVGVAVGILIGVAVSVAITLITCMILAWLISVEKIAYDEDTGRIIGLAIRNDSKKCRAFVWQP